jgi:hypothetical protein
MVEQLLLALAKRPSDSEQALIGALALMSGDVWCVVLLVPPAEFWPGNSVLPISFASKVIGIDNDSGSAVSGASGFDGVAAGVEWVVDADELDELVDVVVLGAVVVVVFGTVVVVVGTESFEVMLVEDAAPAGTTAANTLAAARTRPPVTTAMEERGFRLKVLLLLCMGYTDPL